MCIRDRLERLPYLHLAPFGKTVFVVDESTAEALFINVLLLFQTVEMCIRDSITGVPDEIRGQVVKATIVLAKEYKARTGEELVTELQNHVKKVTAVSYTHMVRGTGIAERTHEYVATKLKEGKAIIALCGDDFAGFTYI